MNNKQSEALIFANDRPDSTSDDLYQWSTDAEEMIRRQHVRIVELEKENSYLNDACAELEALTNMKGISVEIIRVVCASGAAVVIKDDCSLFVEDGADMQEAAEAIVTATFEIINADSFRPLDLTSFIQLRNSRGAVLAVKIGGDVQASPEWPQDTIEFAKMIGKAMLNRSRNLPEKQAIEAMELALSSHDVQLLSYPPQDAWIARGVSEKLRAAISALEAQAKHGNKLLDYKKVD